MLFVFDFDSTVITKESLDEMLLFSVKEYREGHKEKMRKELKKITDKGMNGEIDLRESIQERLELVKLKEENILVFLKEVINFITPSIQEAIDYLKSKNHQVYIISGGLRVCIIAVANKLGIKKENCFANTYKIINNKIELDQTNPLITSSGKSKIIKQIKEKNPGQKVIMIGDGMSDFIPFKDGIADEFLGFGINQKRESIKKIAKNYFEKTSDFINYLKANY